MIKRTERIYKDHHRTYFKGSKSKSIYNEKHLVSINRTTYWFLFIPIFIKEEIFNHNM